MSTFKVVSATMIDTVRTCPLKARFKYIDRLPEAARSGALVLGIAVDVAAKHVVHGLRAGDLKIGVIDAEAVLSQAWDEELARNKGVEIVWPERGSEEKGRATALALLKAFTALPDLADRVARKRYGGLTAAIAQKRLAEIQVPLDKRSKVTFHCPRHTAASLMVAEGVPLFDVAKILGYSTLAVTMRYAHFAPAAGRAGIEKLGKALRGENPSEGAAQGDGAGSVAEGQTRLGARRSA